MERNIKFKILVFALSVLLIFSTISFGEEKVEFTLEECIKKALGANTGFLLATLSAKIAEEKVKESKKNMLPEIELSSYIGLVPRARGNAVTFQDGINDYGSIGGYYQSSLELKQPIYTFGKILSQQKASEMKLEGEKAKVLGKKEETVFRIKTLYYDLLLTKELIKLSEDIKNNFEKATEKSEEKLESDDIDITLQDVLKLKLGLVGAKDELNRLGHKKQKLTDSLKFELGIPAHQEFHIKSKHLKQENIELKKIEDYFDLTLNNKSILKEKKADLHYEEALVKSSESGYYPDFFIRTGIEGGVAPNRDDQRNPFVRDDYNYFKADIALGLKWSLDFSLNSSRVRVAKAKLAKARAEKEAISDSLANTITNTYFKIKETEERVKLARQARKVSRTLLVTNLANFDFGIGEAKDLFESLFIYMRTVKNYFKKIYDYNIAIAQLSFETGQEITNLIY